MTAKTLTVGEAGGDGKVRFPLMLKAEQDEYVRNLAMENRVSRAEMVRRMIDEHRARQNNKS